jgi:hypothetical protein
MDALSAGLLDASLIHVLPMLSWIPGVVQFHCLEIAATKTFAPVLFIAPVTAEALKLSVDCPVTVAIGVAGHVAQAGVDRSKVMRTKPKRFNVQLLARLGF